MDTRSRIRLHPDSPGGGPLPAAALGVVPSAKPPNAAPTPPPVGAGIVPSIKQPNPMPAAAGAGPVPVETKQKIQHIRDMGAASVRHQDSWKRKTNLTGNGATHVKSFHSRLNAEGMAIMDDQINKWLDDHPDYEVKLVTSSIGEWQGKIKEEYLIVHVWV